MATNGFDEDDDDFFQNIDVEELMRAHTQAQQLSSFHDPSVHMAGAYQPHPQSSIIPNPTPIVVQSQQQQHHMNGAGPSQFPAHPGSGYSSYAVALPPQPPAPYHHQYQQHQQRLVAIPHICVPM